MIKLCILKDSYEQILKDYTTQKSRLNCKKPEKSFYPRAARPSAKTSSADRKPRISRG